MSTANSTNLQPNELTAFVREVVLPGSNGSVPRINPSRCRFKLEYRPSQIHRWGIFPTEPIPAHRRVIEYTGLKIDAKEVWRRSFRQHLYVFWLNDRWALDGAFGGSGAEFINHSCDPNLDAHISNGRIFLSSVRAIATGEELTLDYDTGDDGFSVTCKCGSPNCKGIVS